MKTTSLFGRALAKVRKATGLTQRQFAGLVGFSHALIASVETRGKEPTPALLERICEASGASGHALLQGEALTFDGFPYNDKFFADYGRGLRNTTAAVRAMQQAIRFDLEQVLAAAARRNLLVPTLLRLSHQILEFSDQTKLSDEVRKKLVRDVPATTLGTGAYASVTSAPHVLSSKLVALKGRAFIHLNNSDAFGRLRTTFSDSLRSKAPYWPYESEPDELHPKELQRWLRGRTEDELIWFKRNQPELFKKKRSDANNMPTIAANKGKKSGSR